MAKGIKTGGRRKGTPNKITSTARELLSKTLYEQLEKLPQIMEELEAKEKVDILVKLVPYILPKAVSEDEDPVIIERKKKEKEDEELINGFFERKREQALK